MKKVKYLIDGRFLSSMSSGVDRYAYQILNELDKICSSLDISILVPAGAKEVPDYRNIKVIVSKRTKYWTQVVFGGFARMHGMTPVNLCNEVSMTAPKGIVCLHDVCYAETADVFPYVDEIPAQEREWFLRVYKRIKKKTKKIITVSEFSKQRIEKLLGIPSEKITVIGNGWQHFKEVKEDESVFMKNLHLVKGEYFYTLTSANKNKNADWVLRAARLNPDRQFVISGKGLERIADFKEYPNVFYTGFASDQTAKSLMKHCRAFLFPSYYEGFGIPPLEALSTGAQIVVAERASLPEIFGSAAHYINPDDPNVDLEKLLQENTENAGSVLTVYSWKNAAEKLLLLLEEE